MEANRGLTKPSTESSVVLWKGFVGMSCVGGWKSDTAVLSEACGLEILGELYSYWHCFFQL